MPRPNRDDEDKTENTINEVPDDIVLPVLSDEDEEEEDDELLGLDFHFQEPLKHQTASMILFQLEVNKRNAAKDPDHHQLSSIPSTVLGLERAQLLLNELSLVVQEFAPAIVENAAEAFEDLIMPHCGYLINNYFESLLNLFEESPDSYNVRVARLGFPMLPKEMPVELIVPTLIEKEDAHEQEPLTTRLKEFGEQEIFKLFTIYSPNQKEV